METRDRRPGRARERLANAATASLVLCAIVITGLVVRRELSAARTEPSVTAVGNWREFAESGQRIGAPDAPVTIVEFADFQCPACRALSSDLRTLLRNHPGKVAVVYRHFPLRRHPFAVAAARASECAAAQGRFEGFHHALYDGQDSIGAKPWRSYADAAGVADLDAFDRCAAEAGPHPRLAADSAAAVRLRVEATPTLLINERRVAGAPPLPALEELFRSALERAGTQ